MKRWRGSGEKEEANREEGPRRDRHWRRSNNGLLTMIIEHEAAGTLLKSTENRAGGFTCRINFYLVPSLPRPLVHLLHLFLFLRFFISALTATNRFSWSLPVFPVYRRLPRFFREEVMRHTIIQPATFGHVTIDWTLSVISGKRDFSIKSAMTVTLVNYRDIWSFDCFQIFF